jgi:hypothetical protein
MSNDVLLLNMIVVLINLSVIGIIVSKTFKEIRSRW